MDCLKAVNSVDLLVEILAVVMASRMVVMKAELTDV